MGVVLGPGRESDQGGDLLAHPGIHLRCPSDRVGDVIEVIGAQPRSQGGQVGDLPGVELAGQRRGLGEDEGPVQLPRGEFEDRVTVCPGHGDHQVGVGGDGRGELTGDEADRVAAEIHQRLGDLHLLVQVHARAGRLLAIA